MSESLETSLGAGMEIEIGLCELDSTSVEWPTDPSQFKLKTKIGHGAFATVWRASTTVLSTIATHPKSSEDNNINGNDSNDNNDSNSNDSNNNDHKERLEEKRQIPVECAIKVLNLDHVDSNLSEIRLEVQAMRLSSHPNVLSCFEAFVHSTDLWLVTQLMRKGSSLHCLQGARRRAAAQSRETKTASSTISTTTPPSGTVPIKMEQHILYIMHETLLGLQYIHEHNGQIHRDIKAGNILIDHNGEVRIADFGVSGWLVNAGTQQEKAKTFVGTPCWMVGFSIGSTRSDSALG
jgi:serine/threonine protein kinase